MPHYCLNCDDGTTMEYKAKDIDQIDGTTVHNVVGWHCDTCGEIEFADGEGRRVWDATHPTQIIAHTPATGTTGHLIHTCGNYQFRVYNADKTFTDYDLIHSDLEVTIIDRDATFYQTSNGPTLDHSPATLGLKADDISNDRAFQLLIEHNIRITSYPEAKMVDAETYVDGQGFYSRQPITNDRTSATKSAIISVVNQIISQRT